MKIPLIYTALLALAACTSSPDTTRTVYVQQPPVEAMAEQPATVVILPGYYGADYYSSDPARYYTDPHSAYFDQRSSAYHRDYTDELRTEHHLTHSQPSYHLTARPRVTTSSSSVLRPYSGYATRPSKTYSAPAVTRTYNAPAPSRTYSSPTPTRTYSAPAPVTRTYSAPTRTYSAPTRTYSAPSRSYSAPSRSSFSHR